MYVIAAFEQNIFLELAITSLEEKGIAKDQLLATPLDKRTEPAKLFDTIHHADGVSMFDAAAVLGTVFMLLGAIYGYVLSWGPIIWGIIGAIFGLLLGFFIKYFLLRRKNKNINLKHQQSDTEVVLIIRCDQSKWETIESILWEHHALGLGRIK